MAPLALLAVTAFTLGLATAQPAYGLSGNRTFIGNTYASSFTGTGYPTG
jgi:hypothetical protein